MPPVEQVRDTRPPARGGGRLVMVLFWAFGLWVVIDALLNLFSRPSDGAIGPLLGTFVAGVIQVTAAIGITHNGRRMRMIAWVATVVACAGPLIVGIVGWGIPEVTAYRSAWGAFGQDYWYLPVVVNAIGLVWLWVSNPRRIVEIAEQVERHPTLRK